MQHRTLPTWWRSLRRALTWHRRKFAVVAVVAAVLCGLTALVPAAPERVPVVRARQALPGGSLIGSDDVMLSRVPPDVLPEGALAALPDVVGRTVSGRVAAGQMISATDLNGTSARLPAGHVLAPIRLTDEQVVGLLSEGMVVDVLAADERNAVAQVIAANVRIASIPPPLTDGATAAEGRLILVEVAPPTAAALARAAVVSRLSVLWR